MLLATAQNHLERSRCLQLTLSLSLALSRIIATARLRHVSANRIDWTIVCASGSVTTAQNPPRQQTAERWEKLLHS
uniref:Putative secreted protein n=1 Tax=Anopheles darlingi TaxID=43151 RepID=A0A2M4DB01_ANODA